MPSSPRPTARHRLPAKAMTPTEQALVTFLSRLFSVPGGEGRMATMDLVVRAAMSVAPGVERRVKLGARSGEEAFELALEEAIAYGARPTPRPIVELCIGIVFAAAMREAATTPGRWASPAHLDEHVGERLLVASAKTITLLQRLRADLLAGSPTSVLRELQFLGERLVATAQEG